MLKLRKAPFPGIVSRNGSKPAATKFDNWGYCRAGYVHDDLPSGYLRAARARRRHYRHPG